MIESLTHGGLLRICTAGSVDDGKSTLIGRLLHDTGHLTKDQIEAIEEASRKRGRKGIDLALLTDGLRAEREQGITIDVAYRFFSTDKRKFIVADTPGHEQYTRNMITGASQAECSRGNYREPSGALDFDTRITRRGIDLTIVQQDQGVNSAWHGSFAVFSRQSSIPRLSPTRRHPSASKRQPCRSVASPATQPF